MFELDKLKKLTVGDLVDYQRHKRQVRKQEIIDNAKDIYGDNIPPDLFEYLENQLKLIPKIEDVDSLGVEEVQYLIWLSVKKTDPDATLRQVGDWLDADKLGLYVSKILPTPEKLPKPKKKAARKKKVAKRKKKKQNN